MKKKIITLTLIAALSATATTAFAAPIQEKARRLMRQKHKSKSLKIL